MEALAGLRQLDRKLDSLSKDGSKRVARAAMTGMATPLKKAIRQGVNSTTASQGMKRAVRKTIGHSIKRSRDGYGLKVGFGVGKPSKKKRSDAKARAGSSKGGVGISAQNVHWVVFGTGGGSVLAGTKFKTNTSKRFRVSRATGAARKTKSGKSTGSTPAYFQGVLPAYIQSATPAAMEKAAIKAKIALQKEAAKRR